FRNLPWLDLQAFGAIINGEEKDKTGDEVKAKRMRVANAFSLNEVDRKTPRFGDEQADGSENFGIPVQELIENFENDVAERSMIINRRLTTFVTPMSAQFRAAVFTMGEGQRLARFSLPEPAAAHCPLSGSKGVREENFFQLVCHRARLPKAYSVVHFVRFGLSSSCGA